ncbi:MetQ/NlpA family ABC transporter substrate-binding protein [Shimazuella sp. AN120528]|uniref:MetQ/NlpA family ABC transporter substrate-binding protein n=1 Tax=Shimazuella soli TaxID=1892854 RepID=UPI001F10A084|nr:MetQ/NlpA family ABC transporter substrate-binding protein [Shimazuella soli]MCH5585280.1 MetQ/NlpA family ABC transporter substrate-binding protein [Shimazuella soli]
MKKWLLLSFSLILAVIVSACGNTDTSKSTGSQTLTVGATQVPHAEILNFVKPILKKQGVDLQVKVFQDYVLPNRAVEEGQIDANYFQHIPWMETTNKENGFHLVKVVGVHIEPMGAYSQKIKNKSQIKNGATIAVPNATSEITRALLLLDANGVIKLDNRNGEKTVKNIVSNPKHVQIKPLEAAMLPRVLDQVDLAIINTNYALQAKLNPTKDAIFIEDSKSPYVNVLATKKGKENDPRIQKLAKVLNSPEVKKFIEDKYKGAVVPAF